MKSLFKHLFIAVFICLTALAVSAAPAQAQTQAWTGVCVRDIKVGPNEVVQVATIQGAQCLIANVLAIVVRVVGLVGFVMLIIGSFRYMLSGGNTKGTEGARNTITFAIVGLVIVLSAFIILNLIASFTGVDEILFFNIPTTNPETGL